MSEDDFSQVGLAALVARVRLRRVGRASYEGDRASGGEIDPQE